MNGHLRNKPESVYHTEGDNVVTRLHFGIKSVFLERLCILISIVSQGLPSESVIQFIL